RAVTRHDGVRRRRDRGATLLRAPLQDRPPLQAPHHHDRRAHAPRKAGAGQCIEMALTEGDDPMAELAKNSIEGKAEPFMHRVEALKRDLDSERGTYMAKCKALREDIKEVYSEAKEAGVPVRALKGVIKHRELARKQKAIADAMDEDEASAYEN